MLRSPLHVSSPQPNLTEPPHLTRPISTPAIIARVPHPGATHSPIIPLLNALYAASNMQAIFSRQDAAEPSSATSTPRPGNLTLNSSPAPVAAKLCTDPGAASPLLSNASPGPPGVSPSLPGATLPASIFATPSGSGPRPSRTSGEGIGHSAAGERVPRSHVAAKLG